jgi:hypothetical protein
MFHFFIPLAAWLTSLGTGFSDLIFGLRRLLPDVIPNPLRCFKGYISTGAESHTQFAIVNCLAAKSRLGHAGDTAVSLYFV